MPKPSEHTRTSQHRELVEPIKIDLGATNAPGRLNKKFIIRSLYVLLATSLVFILWFVLSAKTIVVDISPTPDELELRAGSLAIKLQDRFLAQAGEYQLFASKAGYYPLNESVSIGMLASYSFKRTLQKKPGLVSINVDPPQLARVYIDNRYAGVAPMQDIALTAGTHTIELQRYRYQPLWSELQVEGAEQKQDFSFAMVPDWATVSLQSRPENAQVWLDGELYGSTPLEVELNAGTHHLELVHPDFAAHIADFVVLPNQPLDLGAIELDRDPSYLIIKSQPVNATVFVNEQKRGSTPLTITALPNVDYNLRFTKPGYRGLSRSARVTAGESKTINVGLKAILATVHLDINPKTASVTVDGKLHGQGDQTLSLTTASHIIEIKESGYEPYILNITPEAGQPIHEKISLALRKSTSPNFPETITNSQGQKLQLIGPTQFTMGASRREQGRRANEVLRDVKLQRRFYIGVKEVSNEEFARFEPNHNSGSFGGIDLTPPKQPVTNITWQQAARYCNWLSKREDLPLSYLENNGKLLAANPLLTGYRLVTEAEWARVARVQSNGDLLRYAWGDQYPPQKLNGNYADEQAKKVVGLTIPDNDDGFSGPAPTGSFARNHMGLYDIAANVAEWMHDYYTIYSAPRSQVSVDPTGPKQGKHHVVRGASWLRGTLSNTRLAYRDYREKPQADIGFRIARYAE